MVRCGCGFVVTVTWWIFLVLTPTKAIPIDNNVEGVPEVACLSDSAKIAIQTEKPFGGHVYVKGQFHVQGCHLDLTNADDQSKYVNLQAARPTIIYEVPYRGCVVKRERTLNPAGLSFTMAVVVQFHHQFLTKVDRAYTITCFYMEALKTVTYGLDVSMIDTTQLYQTRPMPICTYEVLRSGLNGPILRFAQVGDMAYHKWTCLGATGIYGILVHSCAAADGTGDEYKLIDSQGCAIDPVIVNDITYTPDLTMAYVEVHVFKFADKMQLSIQCQVSLCLLTDGGCNGITPPNCAGPHRHINPPPIRVSPLPPGVQPGSPPAASPPQRLYTLEFTKPIPSYSYPPSSAFPPSIPQFPTPPPTGPHIGLRKRFRRRPINATSELRKTVIARDSPDDRSDRYERTIDLATDDIFIFNMDEQMPLGDLPNLLRHPMNQSDPRLIGIDPQNQSSSMTCTSTFSLILSALTISICFISATAALLLYQRRYFLKKLSSTCALRSSGFLT